MDSKAKQIMQHGDTDELLISLFGRVEKIKEIMDVSSEQELNEYCEKYNGFYQYIQLLEQLARGCAEGVFKDILN